MKNTNNYEYLLENLTKLKGVGKNQVLLNFQKIKLEWEMITLRDMEQVLTLCLK